MVKYCKETPSMPVTALLLMMEHNQSLELVGKRMYGEALTVQVTGTSLHLVRKLQKCLRQDPTLMT